MLIINILVCLRCYLLSIFDILFLRSLTCVGRPVPLLTSLYVCVDTFYRFLTFLFLRLLTSVGRPVPPMRHSPLKGRWKSSRHVSCCFTNFYYENSYIIQLFSMSSKWKWTWLFNLISIVGVWINSVFVTRSVYVDLCICASGSQPLNDKYLKHR